MIYTLTLNPALDKTYLVEAIEFNGVNRPYHTYRDSGGKGFNVSRALLRLGIENCALGFVGGATGQWIQSDLNDQGITTQFHWLSEETRTNLVLREANGQYIKINESGPVVQTDHLDTLMEQIDTLAKKDDLWALCGSLPNGIPVGFYQVLIERLQERGAKVALDASGETLRLGIQSRPYMIKPNQFEAWEVLGSDVPITEIPSRFHALGIELVILSLGEAGLIASENGKSVLVKPPSVVVKNPVGAGDAALAGALFGVAQNFSPQSIAMWSVACGTAAAISASNCFENRNDVEEIYQQLSVEEL